MTPQRGQLDVSKQDLEILQSILPRFLAGRKVYAFGSRTTGLATRGSDLDLAVDGPPLTLREEALLSYALEESMLSMHVDLLSLERAQGTFRKRIESELIRMPLSLDGEPKVAA